MQAKAQPLPTRPTALGGSQGEQGTTAICTSLGQGQHLLLRAGRTRPSPGPQMSAKLLNGTIQCIGTKVGGHRERSRYRLSGLGGLSSRRSPDQKHGRGDLK